MHDALRVVQEQIRDRLPEEPAYGHRGDQFKRDEDSIADQPDGKKVNKINRNVRQNQPLDPAGKRAIEEGTATSITDVVAHGLTRRIQVQDSKRDNALRR